MALKQSLQQRLLQKLSPQQIQLMKMLQLPTVELEKRIKEELEINPALDEGEEQANETNADLEENTENKRNEFNFDDYTNDETPYYKTQSNNYSKELEEQQKPLSFGDSLSERLTKQIRLKIKDDDTKKIAEHIIGNLDESGYLRRELFNIVDDLAFSQNIFTSEENLEKILIEVQDLDPAGVGARNLQECLLIQLQRKEQTPDTERAANMIENAFEQFTKKHYQKLLKKFDISEIELKDAILEIERLNPKPGSSFSNNLRSTEHVVPDFTIKIIDGELELVLNGRNAPELHISKSYNEMLLGYKASKEKSRAQKEAVLFIKQKLDAAKWFIDAIRQRQQTLLLTMSAIMHYQKAYFLSGDEEQLRPMILKDIADEVEMDVSTISRVANSKYVDTPYGTKLIKEFFSESMTNDQGEEVSTREIKSILKTIIVEEDKKKPWTDEKLAKILKEKGYPIARRTVAKYREQLDFPVARLRKQI